MKDDWGSLFHYERGVAGQQTKNTNKKFFQ